MHIVLILVGIVVTVLVCSTLADRLRLPAPMVLLAIGIIGSFLPFVPSIELTPELVLVALLPPLLYSSALQTSILDIRANLSAVLQLSVALVVVTTLAVGAVLHWLAPDIPWAVAIALGAVVAPPDAVSASAVARRIGLPHRIVTVLEGESLLNDATALVALRTAVAAIAGTVALGSVGLDFVIAAGGGVLIGLLVAAVVVMVRRHVKDPMIDTGISFVIPFGAYILAEEVHASGVIAVVVAGLLIGHKAPIVQTAASRITERVTWRSIAYLLEHAVFLLIGLQVAGILRNLDPSLSAGYVLGVCAAVLATVIGVRIVWMVLMHLGRRILRPGSPAAPVSYALVTGWAGMRGVVTIAAVFVIPSDVPHHDLLVLVALAVVLGTLYLQGLSLPWLTRLLRVEPADPADDALARATLLHQAHLAGIDTLDECEESDPHAIQGMLRERLEQRTAAAWEQLSTTEGQETPSAAYTRYRRRMIDAERARVLEVRSEGVAPSHVVTEVLGTLDLEESMLDTSGETRGVLVARGAGEGGYCADLEEHPAVETDPNPVCERCEAEGITPVALRQCLVCGEIGCCDSSPRRHATDHFHRTGHAVMQSAEPGETWRWCYVHTVTG